MENIEVMLGSDSFEVTVDGAVFQDRRHNGTKLDEVRLIAADSFLGRRDLNKTQRKYWVAVRTVVPEGQHFRA